MQIQITDKSENHEQSSLFVLLFPPAKAESSLTSTGVCVCVCALQNMHGFIVTALKKLHDECGRKQVALKAAAKSLLGAFARKPRRPTHTAHTTRRTRGKNNVFLFLTFLFFPLSAVELEQSDCVLSVTKDELNEEL
jgi:hypothetical protein